MENPHSQNWDDMRFVLAVADTGTVSGAARLLGVNHATVLRRIAAFEERYGAPVFDRSASGYSVRDDRRRMIEGAREVDRAVQSVENMMRGIDAPLTGRVRITSTDTLCRWVLPEIVASFPPGQQGLHLSLLSSNLHLDFSRALADVTVRPARQLASDLKGVAAARLGFGVYARADAPDRWIGFAGALAGAPVADWLRETAAGQDYAASADSFTVLAAMAQQGLGRVLLPRFVGEDTPGLIRQPDWPEIPGTPIWVASHFDMADVSRIATTVDYLVQALRARSTWLETGRRD